jgi:hypothetical protein
VKVGTLVQPRSVATTPPKLVRSERFVLQGRLREWRSGELHIGANVPCHFPVASR